MDRMRRSPWQKWSGTTGSPVNVTSGAIRSVDTLGIYRWFIACLLVLQLSIKSLQAQPDKAEPQYADP